MSENIYEKMTEKIGLGGSKIIPELFKMVADSKEAELLMAMPGTPEQLAEKLGRPVDELDRMCRQLYHKGLVFKSFKGETVGYRMGRDLIQFHDATILWPEAPQEFLDLWQKFMEEEWPAFARMADEFLPKPFARVVPVEQAAKTGDQKILDSESVKHIIDNAEVIAVTKCTCRVIAHKCDKPVEVCLQVNNAARYAIDRESGREVSKKEALEIITKAEEAGLVHITTNTSHVDHFICNCCSCCCQTLPLVISEGLKLNDPSRFEARIDQATCTACGTCMERCFFGAISETANNDGETVVEVITDKCLGCGLCHVTCPEEAITLVEVRPAEFIPA
jgi:Pyruvate/2-oxoacid:ferredoxin oxidoreductase delta subunit